MGLETGTYINSLNTANPDGANDAVSTLDDHHKLVKSTIKNTFPNIDGAMSATQDELNYNDGASPGTVVASTTLVADGAGTIPELTIGTATITTMLDGDSEELIPATTKMVFFQAAAPNAGWVIDGTHNNKMLRVVSSSGGGNGGSDSPIQMTGAQVPQHPHTLSVDADVHAHDLKYVGSLGSLDLSNSNYFAYRDSSSNLHATTGATNNNTVIIDSDSHSHTGTADNNGSNATWDPYYIDIIICTKQ